MTTAALTTAQAATEGIYLGRQSILDRHQDLVAFELLFRSGEVNAARITDGTVATATVIRHMLNEFGLESVLGRYKGFINLDTQMIMSDTIELLPKDRVVLEILETVNIDSRVVERLEHLKQIGFTLALDDIVCLPPVASGVLDLIDIVKIDVKQLGMDRVPALVRSLKPWKVRLLAEKVDDRAQVDACLELGFELFQGYYFAKPQIIAGKRLSPAHATVMRLLGMLVADVDSADIAMLLKQEPTLTMNLLRLTNSVSAGARSHITSVASAMMLVGRRQLMRWLQLLLFSNSSGSGKMPSALMQLAATRGRMMELLAAAWRTPGIEDRAFMAGIMSLMEALLSTPMTEIIAPLPLAEDVRSALLERSGLLGRLLTLIETVEERDPLAIEPILANLSPLTAGDVETAHAQALAWANSIGS
jgi:c-di-GMP-related signal transduction protein